MTDYKYKDLSRHKRKDGVGCCDTCKHNTKKWYELPCDACCLAHSGWEKKDE